MRRMVLVSLMLMFAFGNSFGRIHSWKGWLHLSLVPFIEATGVYADVRMIQDAKWNGTKPGAIANLSLLCVQSGLGATLLFSNDNLPPVVRVIHRIVGASVIATGLWVSIAGTRDPGVSPGTRDAAYAHTTLACVPLILFTF